MKKILEKYGEVKENIDLKKYNTYGIGGKARFLVKPLDISNLVSLIKYLKEENMAYFLLGSGSNVILPDEDFLGVIIRLDNLNKIVIQDDLAFIEGGVPLTFFSNYCLSLGYTNLVFCNGVPGTVASALVGNVGCFKHEIYEYLVDVTILNEKGNIEKIAKENIQYSYRYTEFKKRNIVILKATFKLEKGSVSIAEEKIKEQILFRQKNQPLGTKNAGSVFGNPLNNSAGKLIEEAGLKNRRVGGAVVSTKHANFIINDNNAKSSDIISLIEIIKKEVKEKYNIDLKLEQQIVKW